MTDTLSPGDLLTTAAVPVTTPVTAVVVTRGRTGYLPATLRALAGQTRRPLRVLVVDVAPGHDARVGEVLDAAYASSTAPVPRLTAVRAPGARTFGEAVAAGLGALEDAVDERPTTWLWLLHDDSAPAPEALARLVRTVANAPSVAVAGCKQRTWTDPERLLEVGVRTTRSGRRHTDVEPGELDQGQHDGASDVLGVGLAGALVRRDVWDALGGTDPALGPFGDGLDLCRRARLAGHRVVVDPGAVVRHAQAAYHGLRPARGGPATPDPEVTDVDLDGDGEPDAADPTRSFAARRLALLHYRLVGAPPPLLPLVVAMVLAAAVLRALGQLGAKHPQLAVAELRVALVALLRPRSVARARRRARGTRALPRRTLRPLQAGWRDVWQQARDRRLARREARRAGTHRLSELELRELAALASRRRAVVAGLVAALVLLTVVALGPLLGPVASGAPLVGEALAGATTSLADVWAAATSGWVPGGLGAPGPADPLLVVLTPLAAALGGSLGAATALLVLGGVVLSGVGAWAAAGAATRAVTTRAWAAVAWAAAPALLLAVGDGRVGAVVAHAALPWVALGVARAVGVHRVDQVLSGLATARRDEEGDADAAAAARAEAAARTAEQLVETPVRGTPVVDEVPHPRVPVGSGAVEVVPGTVRVPGTTGDAPSRVLVGAPDPTGSVAAAAGAALALVAAVAGAPVLLLPAVVVLAFVALVLPRGRHGRLRVLGIALPSLVLLAPLLREVVTRGTDGVRLLLAEPGGPAPVVPAPALARLLGVPADPTSLVPGGLPDLLADAWPHLLGVVLLVVAGLALLRGPEVARGVRVLWLTAAVGAAAGAVVATVPAAVGPDAVGPAWTGATVSLTWLGLLGAGVLGCDRLSARTATHTFGWRQPVVAVGAAVAVVLVAASAVGWAWSARTDGPALRASSTPVVPVVGQQGATSDAASRLLALRLRADGSVDWSLLRGNGDQQTDHAAAVTTRALSGPLGEPSVAGPDAAADEVAGLAARLVQGAPGDVASELAALGVGDVLVPGPDDGDPSARGALVSTLDATAGLERVTHDGAGTLWRVRATSGTTVASWARLVTGPDGDDQAVVPAAGRVVTTSVPTGGADRLLVLAERADPGWRAWLDGRRLPASGSGWRQAFEVGADGGLLEVRYVSDERGPWLATLAAAMLVTVLLALPVRRRRGVRT